MIITDPNTKSEYTQTEEIFFKMHWAYFSGQYKIMNCTRIIVNNNKAFDFTDNILGQLKKSNLFNKQIDDGFKKINKLNGLLPVNRAKSFNNKILLNNKNNNRNSVFLNSLNQNMNNNKKYYQNNINKNNNDNEQKNNVDNNNKIKVNQNNKLLNYMDDKVPKNNLLNKDMIKTSSGFPINLFKNKQNIGARNNQKGENDINNNFITNKYNNFNSKQNKDNIKLKMAKSSTSFYKK
jgi:hypothetical protein